MGNPTQATASSRPPAKKIIPCFDLSRQYKTISPQIETAVKQVLDSGKFVLSNTVEDFERSFAQYSRVSFGIGVGSGTDALIFALKAVGVKTDDEVIVPSFTFVATVYAILHLGARPVYADVDYRTYTLDPACAAKLVTPRTKAILPVHLFGQMANMEALDSIAKRAKIGIVEDAAQAHGATWKSKMPGAFGHPACFSFYPTKNLGACGDAGMVLTGDRGVAERIKQLRNLGRATHDDYREPGWTSRLDAVQAAILSVKLRYLNDFNDNRRRIAGHYLKNLAATPLGLPHEIPGGHHVYHLFVVRVPQRKRDALKSWLENRGISTLIHYKTPVHRQPFYLAQYPAAEPRPLPVTERLADECLSLPMFPEMTEEESSYVCDAIIKFYGRDHSFSSGTHRRSNTHGKPPAAPPRIHWVKKAKNLKVSKP